MTIIAAHTDSAVSLETPHLVLRDLSLRDIGGYVLLHGTQSMQYYREHYKNEKDRVKKAAHKIKRNSDTPRTSWLLGVFEKETDRLIGDVHVTRPRWGRAYLDFGIDKSRWGKGLGTELVHCMTDFVHNTLDTTKAVAEVFASDEKSIRLLEGCGYIRGREFETKNFDGQNEGLYIYEAEKKRKRVKRSPE